MKTLPVLAIFAAPSAFVLLPFIFEASVAVLFTAGLLALMFVDYTRRYRPITVRAARVEAVAPQRTERFGLAA